MSDSQGFEVPVKIDFDDLPPQSQVERTLTVASDYMETVESRIAKSNLQGVVAQVARYQALDDLSSMISGVKGKLVDELILGTGLITARNIKGAIEGGLEKAKAFIGNIQFAQNFGGGNAQIQYLSAIGDAVHERQLEIASEISESAMRRFPGLSDYIEQNPTSEPSDLLKQYQRAVKLKVRDTPRYLINLLYFNQEVKAARDWEGSELAVRYKREAHLKRWPFMDSFAESGLTPKEQEGVKQAISYGTSLNLTKYKRF